MAVKKRAFKALKVILAAFALLGLLIFGVLCYIGNPQMIKGQDVIATYPSPNGTYILTTYLNNGGATTDFSVLGRVQSAQTNKARNIYWNIIARFPELNGWMKPQLS